MLTLWGYRSRRGGRTRKVLLVCPEFPDTCRSFRHTLKFEGRYSAFPRLGLPTAPPETQLWRRLRLQGYRRIISTIYSTAEYRRRALDCLSR